MSQVSESIRKLESDNTESKLKLKKLDRVIKSQTDLSARLINIIALYVSTMGVLAVVGLENERLILGSVIPPMVYVGKSVVRRLLTRFTN